MTHFCERTGMRYVSTHSMRHLNASLLINAGIDVKTVQSCLGHSTATTTLQIYSHTFQSPLSNSFTQSLQDIVLPIYDATLLFFSKKAPLTI